MKKKKKTDDKPGNPQVNIRFPGAVSKALTVDAKKTAKTVQAVALGIIADHYGIEVAAPQRGRPKSVESE